MHETIIPNRQHASSLPPTEATLRDANLAFHNSYDRWIEKTMNRLGGRGDPVIMVRGDTMILIHDDYRNEVTIVPESYHRLKAIGHAAFGLYTTMMANGFGPLKSDTKSVLKQQARLMREVSNNIADFELPEGCEDSQKQILDSTAAVAELLVTTGRIEEDTVRSFVTHTMPHLLEGAAFAAEIEIDLIHGAVAEWRELLGEHNWEAIHVIIAGGHQARFRETSFQYFQRLLDEEQGMGAATEDRVVFAEGLFNEEDMLALLAKHIIDQKSSNAYFGDRKKMQEDFLADSTAAYLEKVLPRIGAG